MTEGMRGSFEQKREEVERAHFFRARAKLTLRESSPDEPKPDIIDYQACFELWSNSLYNFSKISSELLEHKEPDSGPKAWFEP